MPHTFVRFDAWLLQRPPGRKGRKNESIRLSLKTPHMSNILLRFGGRRRPSSVVAVRTIIVVCRGAVVHASTVVYTGAAL